MMMMDSSFSFSFFFYFLTNNCQVGLIYTCNVLRHFLLHPYKTAIYSSGPSLFFFFFFFLHLFPFFWWLTLIEAVGTWWATRDPARTIIIRSPFSSPLNFVFFFILCFFFISCQFAWRERNRRRRVSSFGRCARMLCWFSPFICFSEWDWRRRSFAFECQQSSRAKYRAGRPTRRR